MPLWRCCRCLCPGTLCGANVDDVFAYTTTKNIKIRDARLGLLHLSLMICIMMYILVYQLIGKLGYLKFAEAQNSARLTLQEPTANCNPNDSGCRDTFSATSQLPYCCAHNSSCQSDKIDQSCKCDYRRSFKDYECTWLGGDDAALIRESSIMITTFTHDYQETLNTSCFSDYPVAGDACDKLWIVTSLGKVFTADVEQFTVLIDHSVTTPSTGLATTSRQMTGMLFVDPEAVVDGSIRTQDALCKSRSDAVNSVDGGSPTDTAPCYLKPHSAGGLDYFTVGTLLQAMGVSLEEESYPGSGHSARYEGLTANLVIEYSNWRFWHGTEKNISYIYRPLAMPQSTFKSSSLTSTDLSLQQRLKKDKHGILFEVRPGGQLAVFDFTQLLLQLTTSLTLLAMATVGVNLLAQYVLRMRHFYKVALYEDNTDFANLEALESQPEDELRRELRAMNLPDTEDKYRMILLLLQHGYRPPRSSTDAPSGTGSIRSVLSPGRTAPVQHWM